MALRRLVEAARAEHAPAADATPGQTHAAPALQRAKAKLLAVWGFRTRGATKADVEEQTTSAMKKDTLAHYIHEGHFDQIKRVLEQCEAAGGRPGMLPTLSSLPPYPPSPASHSP